MPTIRFEFPVAEIWLSEDDFDGYETESFDYEYDSEILHEELLVCFMDEYNLPNKDMAKSICDDYDLWDSLEEQYGFDVEDAIRDRLYDEAYEAWKGEN